MATMSGRERGIYLYLAIVARESIWKAFSTSTTPRQGGIGRVRTETRFQSPRSTHGEKPGPRESSESQDSEGPVLRSLYAVYRRIIPAAYVQLHLPMHRRVAVRVLFSTILGIELITLLSREYAPRDLAKLNRRETRFLPLWRFSNFRRIFRTTSHGRDNQSFCSICSDIHTL